MPMLREFTDAHVLGSSLSIHWEAPADGLATQINDAVNALEALLQDAEHAPEASETVECNLHLWHDDLRRVHLLSNELATKEFQLTCAQDPAVRAAFADRDMREQALWISGWLKPVVTRAYRAPQNTPPHRVRWSYPVFQAL